MIGCKSHKDIIGSKKAGYENIFGHNYKQAVEFVSENHWIEDSLEQKGIEPEFALSVVFPQIIRYSSFKDKLEVSSLLTMYVQFGERYVDFSVGTFQMKPSFAEQIEKDCMNLNLNLYHQDFDTTCSSQARLARVRRLNSVEWQVKYLAMFVALLDYKLDDYMWLDQNEKLRFYATAYNYGYFRDFMFIQKATVSSTFYIGTILPEKKYCYSDISLDYYLKRNS